MWLFVLLVVVPIIEIALFIQVGGWIGLWPTIAIVLLTAILGAALLRSQGLAVLRDIEARVKRGEDPRGPLLHGLMILVAGIVLLTPGFFTDAIGFALLIPPVRQAIIEAVGRRIVIATMQRRGRDPRHQDPGGRSDPAERPGDQTIETEYEVVDDRDGATAGSRQPKGRPSGWQRPD